MTHLFGIPIDTLTTVLLAATLAIIGVVALLALGNAIFFRIGVRNIPRRRTQMWLIIFALMLSTTLLSSVLATGDVITSAVQTVAVYNLGSVDETIEGGHGALGVFPDGVYYQINDLARHDSDIAAVGAALVEHDLLVADSTSRQVRSKVTALAIIPGSEQGFGGMQNNNGRGHLTITALGANEIYLNNTAAVLLNAHAGDNIFLYSKRWPGQRYQMHVAAIVVDGGLVGSIVKIDLVCAQRGNSEMTSAIVILHSSKALFAARNDGERRDLRAHLSRRTIRHEQIVLDQRCSHSRDIGIMAGEVIDSIIHSIWKNS